MGAIDLIFRSDFESYDTIYVYVNLFTKERKKEKVITALKKKLEKLEKEIQFNILIFRLFETVLGLKIKALSTWLQIPISILQTEHESNLKQHSNPTVRLDRFVYAKPEQTSRHKLSAFNKGNTCTTL